MSSINTLFRRSNHTLLLKRNVSSFRTMSLMLVCSFGCHCLVDYPIYPCTFRGSLVFAVCTVECMVLVAPYQQYYYIYIYIYYTDAAGAPHHDIHHQMAAEESKDLFVLNNGDMVDGAGLSDASAIHGAEASSWCKNWNLNINIASFLLSDSHLLAHCFC